MLKRNWYRLLVVSIIVVLIAGVAIAILWHQCSCNNTKSTQSTDGMGSTQPTDGTENSFALDGQYTNSYLGAASNYEKCEVNRQFAEKWRQEAELYLNKICEIADEDLKQAIIAGQTAWENAYPIRIEENLAYLQYVYTTGTIVPILHSKYAYDLQRERAIELYGMYNKVKFIWDIIQEYGPLPSDSVGN